MSFIGARPPKRATQRNGGGLQANGKTAASAPMVAQHDLREYMKVPDALQPPNAHPIIESKLETEKDFLLREAAQLQLRSAGENLTKEVKPLQFDSARQYRLREIAILECTRRISFPEFCGSLVASYKKAVSKGFDASKAVFLLPKNGYSKIICAATTSSWWVLSLLSELVPEFRIQPWQVCNGLSLDIVNGKVESSSQYAYVDDAMYSGTQATDVAGTWKDRMNGEIYDSAPKRNRALFFLVPYTTRYAEQRLQAVITETPSNVMHLCSVKYIATLDECTMEKGHPTKYNNGVTGTYFDHKFPDSLSTLQSLASFVDCDMEGYVRGNICILPPYKNSLLFSNHEPEKSLANILDANSNPRTHPHISKKRVEHAYYVLPNTWTLFNRFRLPTDEAGNILVKWSHVLIPGQHETYVAKLPENALVVNCWRKYTITGTGPWAIGIPKENLKGLITFPYSPFSIDEFLRFRTRRTLYSETI